MRIQKAGRTSAARFSLLAGALFAVVLTVGCGAKPVVGNHAPSLTGITPPTLTVSGSAIMVTLNGSGFTRDSTAMAGAAALNVEFISTTQLTAQIPGSLASVVSAPVITVRNPSPGGGTSAPISLPIFGLGVVTATGNPQVSRYTIETPVDADVNIEFGLDTSYGTPTWTRPTPGGGGTVEILVAGMHGFSDYHMRAVAAIPGGPTHFDVDQTFTTGGLDPATLPAMTPTKSGSLTPTPGVTFMTNIIGSFMTYALDVDGNIIWFYNQSSLGVRLLEDGTLFTYENDPDPAGTNAIRIVNLAGETVKFTTALAVNQKLTDAGLEPVAEMFHHDAILLPNGHYVALTYHYQDFLDLDGLPGTTNVQLDGIVEMDENLDPVWSWSTIPHLDINRHPMTQFWPDENRVYDHAHNNGLVYSPADGNLIVSLRHQHWVIKIDFQDGFGTGDILWRFGNEGNFGASPLPVGSDATDWQYAQHYPNLMDTTAGVFRLGVYDNGNLRPDLTAGGICEIDPDINCFSRSVVFEIDELMGTSTLLWKDVLPFYSPLIGSSQWLGSDRILHDSGAINGVPGEGSSIREVTMEPTPQIVWQLDIPTWHVYRAIRYPSLYPGVQW